MMALLPVDKAAAQLAERAAKVAEIAKLIQRYAANNGVPAPETVGFEYMAGLRRKLEKEYSALSAAQWELMTTWRDG